jgi:hypothetical protein
MNSSLQERVNAGLHSRLGSEVRRLAEYLQRVPESIDRDWQRLNKPRRSCSGDHIGVWQCRVSSSKVGVLGATTLGNESHGRGARRTVATDHAPDLATAASGPSIYN